MSFVLAAMTVLLFIGLKMGIKEPVDDYISKDGTLAVKGFFVLIIIFFHAGGYIPYDAGTIADYAMCKAMAGLGQLIVVAFLFYSGYGIMLSVMSKKDYIKHLPSRRFLPLLIKFDVAVALFLICDLITDNIYSHKTVLLSLIAWESVGNSNWYIFATFVTYLICFVSFGIFGKNYKAGAVAVTLLTVVYIVVTAYIGKPERWYDTVIVFPLGVWFALLKPTFDKITSSKKGYIALSASFLTAFAVTWYLAKTVGFFLHLRSLFFALLLVTVTRRFSPRNKILSFFGRHVFSFFILQRIPMLLISHFFPDINRYVFVALSLILTCALGILFDALIKPETLFAKKKENSPVKS